MSSIENAASLLKCFNAECATLTVGEAAERLGLAKPTTSRLMRQMREAGLLEQIGESGRHRPARLVSDSGAAFLASARILALAEDALTAVCRRVGHTGFVSVLDGRDVTAAVTLRGTGPTSVQPTISRMPARRAATGRTLLGRMPDDAVRRLHASLPGPDVAALIARLDVLRDEGYEISRSEAVRGVDCVAVAVCDPAANETVSLCVSFPAATADAERYAIIDALLRSAADLATAVGDTGFGAHSVLARESAA